MAKVRLPQLPAALWWSHNTSYHRWLLAHLPPVVGMVLDVGCGAGRLACTLAQRAERVDAVDVSEVMIAAARQRCPDADHVRWLVGDILNPDLPLRRGGYDVVTALSSLHHLPLEAGLERLAALVRPGGVLLVVGHHRPVTLVDRVLDLAALVANAAVGAVLAATGRAGKPDEQDMPVRPPQTTLAQVRAAAAALPGARITRGLFWRHLLTWRRPTQP